MCEPDPACTRAKSSSSSSTCHRRRRTRRQLFRLCRFHRLRSKRVLEWMSAEEWASTREPSVRPSPRTRRHRPRRPCALRVSLKRCGTSSVIASAAPYVCWPKIKLVVRAALKNSMHANMLAPARYGRRDGTLLLLTWLGVLARPTPRTVHLCRPPRRRKLWRGPSYSWITLRRRTRLTNGGPLSRASSASPTATLRGNHAPQVHSTDAHSQGASNEQYRRV